MTTVLTPPLKTYVIICVLERIPLLYVQKGAVSQKRFKSTGANLWYTKFKINRTLVKQLHAHDKRAHRLRVEKSLFRRPDDFW